MSKKFFNCFRNGFCAIAPVGIGAFGGMMIMKALNNNMFDIILGISIIIITMLINIINLHELIKKD